MSLFAGQLQQFCAILHGSKNALDSKGDTPNKLL